MPVSPSSRCARTLRKRAELRVRPEDEIDVGLFGYLRRLSDGGVAYGEHIGRR